MTYRLTLTGKHMDVLMSAIYLFCNVQTGNFHSLKELFEKEYSKDFSSVNDIVDALEKIARGTPEELLESHNNIYKSVLELRSQNNSEEKFTLKCTEEELKTISVCLDFYNRILIGQFDRIIDLFYETENKEDIKTLLIRMRKVFLPELGDGFYCSYGIANKDIAVNAKVSYEMYKIIRKELWMMRGCIPQYSVDGDGPLRLSEEPYMKIERIGEF